jgi:heptose-I-phosphate ethanolaminephosphotransferase
LSASGQPDGILLSAFREALHNDMEKNKIIFVHLMGSHHSYACRYPKTFARFDHRQAGDLTDAGFRTEEMKTTIDAYDNSILYGDSIYNALLTELEQMNTSSYLLYFSDHGEEVFDIRNACGHFLSNVWPCQCKIPFVLWRSERYQHENPHIVVDTARPYSTENVIHAISTLSGFEYPDYDPSLSIFTVAYVKPEVRIVGQESYGEILKKNSK